MSRRVWVALLVALAVGPRPLAALVSSGAPAGLLVFPFVVADPSTGTDTWIRITNVGDAPIIARCTYVDGSLAAGSATAFDLTFRARQQQAWLAGGGQDNPPPVPTLPFTGTLRCQAVGGTVPAGDALVGTATVQRAASSGGDSATYAATGFHATGPEPNRDDILILGGDGAEYDACPAEVVLQSFLDGALVELGADAVLQRETATTLVLATCSQNPIDGAAAMVTVRLTSELGQQLSTTRSLREQLVTDLSRFDTATPATSIFNSATLGTPTGSISITPADGGSGVLALALTAFVDPNDAAHSFRAAVAPQLLGERAQADRIDLAVPTPEPPACTGDCDANQMVAINELITGVNIALGNQAVTGCQAFDPDGSGSVTINELITGVNNALNGCD